MQCYFCLIHNNIPPLCVLKSCSKHCFLENIIWKVVFAIYTMITLFISVTLHIQRLYILGQMKSFPFGPIDLYFLTGFMFLVQGYIVALLEIPVTLAELSIHDPVRIFGLVFLPQEHQGNTFFLHFTENIVHVGLR